jgi:tripartite-type tricarboxylate transporter receptor subunit TctC
VSRRNVPQSHAMAELLAADGVSPAGGTRDQFGATIKTTIERWQKVVQKAGIKIE